MNCQQFDQIVVDLGRARIADGGMQEVALDHARSCPRCAARLSDQRKLTVALRAVSAAAGNEQAPAGVERALLSAFRAEFDPSRPANTAGAASPRRGGAAVWRVWTVAAAAIVLLGMFAAWKLRPARPVERVSSPQITDQKTAEVTGEAQAASAVVRHAAPRSRRTAKHGAPSKLTATPEQTSATEATTRFYPLPYGSGLGLDEGWALVRVQVRRSSLASLGVPVSAGSAAEEMLTADVVVGQDGLARGIRFVQ